MAWYIWSSVVRPQLSDLRKMLFADILRVDAVGSISPADHTGLRAHTALVGAVGGPDALAG
jgi:hypothetical protein